MAEDIKLLREKKKIEQEIAAIKKKANDENRQHTDSELRKLKEYEARKKKIAKEEQKQFDAEQAAYLKSLELISKTEELQSNIMKVVKVKGGYEKVVSMEYYKQGSHLHKFLETHLEYDAQVYKLQENLKFGTSLYESQQKTLSGFAPAYQDLIDSQSENLDLSQKLGKQYNDMGHSSFQDLTKEAEEQVELAERRADYVKNVMIPALEHELATADLTKEQQKEIEETIKRANQAKNIGLKTAKNNLAQAEKQKVISEQTAAAAEFILDPMNKVKNLLESTNAGKLVSSLVGVGDATDHFSKTMTNYISDSLDPDNPMNFGLAMSKMFDKVDKNGRKTRGQFSIMFDKLKEGFEELKKNFGALNSAMGGMLGPALAVVAVLMIAKKVAEMFYGGMLETRKEFGLTHSEAAGLQNTLNTVTMEMKFLGGSAEDTKAAAEGIMDNMGGVGQVTTASVKSMARLSALYGISGENAGILRAQMGAVGVSSQEAFDSQLGSVAALAQAGGVAPAKILNDVAANSESFAKFAGEGGENVFKAAVAARQLGIDMATVDKMAESLLSFEESINSQMEASMLLGRSINTDKAREMALSGNLEGMQKEITKQIGTAAEFEKLNVVQRQSLAAAFGISVDELAKMVTNQDKLNKMTFAQKQRQDLIADVMEKIGEIFTRFMGIFKALIPLAIGLLSPFLAIAGVLVVILGYFSDFIQWMNKANVLGVGLGDVIMFAAGAALLFRTNLLGGGLMASLTKMKDMMFAMGGKLKGLGGMFGGGGPTTKSGKPDMRFKANKKPAIPQSGKGGGGPLGGMFEKFDAKKALGGAAALLIISAALFVTAKALQEFAKVSWGDMGKAGVALLGLTLTLAAIGAIMMSGVGALAIIAGAGAMLIMASALLVLGIAIQQISKGMESFVPTIQALAPMSMSILKLAGAFTALGYSMAGMALGALALLPALPVLMALGAIGAVGTNLLGGGEKTAANGESPVELKLIETNAKLDKLIEIMGEGGIIAENLHGIKRNTGDFTDSIMTA